MDPTMPPMMPPPGPQPGIVGPMGPSPMAPGGMPMPGGPMPPMAPPIEPPPPDPIEILLDTIRALDPMALRDFLQQLKKADREMLLDVAQDDPELAQRILAAFPLPADYEPKRPKWYKQPPKPDVATVLSTARRDYDAHRELRQRFKDDLDAYFNRTWGRFGVDQKTDAYNDESTAFVSTALSSEINKRVAMLAEHDITYQVPPLAPDLIDETQKEENFLYYLDDLAERRHANRAGGSFKYDVADSIEKYGRVIVRRMLDLDDCDDPFDELLVDPTTCCPIWGGKHGLLRVTRWFSDEIGNVARDYGVNPSVITNPEGNNAKGEPYKVLSIENTTTVIEWYDEHWFGVFTEDGRTIRAIAAHKYAEAPFIVQLVSRGLPAMFTDPGHKTGSEPGDEMGGRRKSDLVLKGVSAVHWLKYTVRQREAFMGKIYDALIKSGSPPIWMGQDTFAKTRAPSRMGTRSGKVYTYDRDHEAPAVPQYAPMPAVVAPLMEALGSEWGMGALPRADYGDAPSNTSSAALDGLTEGGSTLLTPSALALQSFYQRRAEQSLRFWRDWGRLIEDAEGRYGVFNVPMKRRTPRGPAFFELTPDIIERTGTRVRVRLTNVRLSQLGAVGAAFIQLIQGDLMTKRDAIERLGNPNPEEVTQERDFEKMQDDQRTRDLRMLEAAIVRAEPDADLSELRKIQTMLFAQGLMAQLGSGSGGGGMGGPPQGAAPPPMGGPEMQGNPMAPPPISAGVNMGNYGLGPGSQGGVVGRPPMPGAPLP